MKSPFDPQSDPLMRSVEATVAAYDMVQPGDRVLVAISGGPDSTALLMCLHHLADGGSFLLGAAHLNHGLRGERAAHDARHAAALADALDVPFVTESRSVEAYRLAQRISPEEAAREVRYQFLQEVARKHGYNRIALGHHQNDDAELVLMRILRGSGPLGLAGIPPKRLIKDESIAIIRPLIRTPRSKILSFLERCQTRVVKDESNTDIRFLRNRIRHRLLPLLESEYNPSVVTGLSRMAHLMRDEEEWLDGLATDILRSLTLADHGSLLILDRRGLATSPVALQRRLLRTAVRRCKGDLRRMGFSAVEEARRFAAEGAARGECDLPGGLVVRGVDDRLYVQRFSRRRGQGRPYRPVLVSPEFAYPIPGPGRYTIREAGVTMIFSQLDTSPQEDVYGTGQRTAFFDMNELGFPLSVRSFCPGDRLTPMGLNGTQKVKKIFSDRKIAPEHRHHYPLLLYGDQILWVVGLRQSEIGKIDPTTRQWLKVEAAGCLFKQDDYF